MTTGAPVSLPGACGGRLSWSQVQDLIPHTRYGCARKWAFQKVARLPFVASPAMAEGSAFDDGVSAALAPRLVREAAPSAPLDMIGGLEAITARLRREAREHRDWAADWPEAAYAHLSDALGLYARELAAVDVALTQVKLEAIVDGVPILGYADRVDRMEDGSLRLVDLKHSGSPKWKGDGADVVWEADWVADVQAQLALYAACFQALQPDAWPLPIAARVEVVVSSRARKMPLVRALDLSLTDEHLGWVRARLRDAAATAWGGVYAPRPGVACTFCSYRPVCADVLAMTTEPFERSWQEFVQTGGLNGARR